MNNIDKLEKAIEQKYGRGAIERIENNVRTPDQEQIDAVQTRYNVFSKKRESYNKTDDNREVVLTERAKNRLKNYNEKKCCVCGILIDKITDSLFHGKYEVCEGCYYRYIEDREKRWESGWRPNKNNGDQ